MKFLRDLMIALACLVAVIISADKVIEEVDTVNYYFQEDVQIYVAPPKTIELNGQIGTGDGIEILKMLEEDRDYIIRIENFGGSAYDMISVLNRLDDLKSKGYKITTETYGFAMSAGWMIFSMGDVRRAHSGSIFMTHGAGVSSGFGGRMNCRTAPDNTHQKQSLCLLDEVVKERVMESTGISEEDIDFLLYDEDYKYIDAEVAMRMKIVTEFIDK